jgi:hypothetical protein
MTTQFWLNNPTILLNSNEILEIFPEQRMNYERKLNAITRLIIILTFLGYLITQNGKLVLTGILTLACICFLYTLQLNKQKNKNNLEAKSMEAFTNNKNIFNNVDLVTSSETFNKIRSNFTEPTPINPSMNVLLTEINDNPDRKTAAPAFAPFIEKEINESTKKFVASNFNNDPNIDERLFKDLGDSFLFDQSMRTWYATPNTIIPSDQKSFAEYCYGDMISCKEGNEFACTRSAPPRWTNY